MLLSYKSLERHSEPLTPTCRSALIDAQKSIDLDKTYTKGYYRMATAKLALGKHKEALTYFRQVLFVMKLKKTLFSLFEHYVFLIIIHYTFINYKRW